MNNEPRRLNVRCCCQPVKIYGTLPVPDNVAEGQTIAYPLYSKMGDSCLAQLRLTAQTITKGPDLLRDPCYRTELALKYEGDDKTFEEKLEVLRRIGSFREDVRRE